MVKDSSLAFSAGAAGNLVSRFFGFFGERFRLLSGEGACGGRSFSSFSFGGGLAVLGLAVLVLGFQGAWAQTDINSICTSTTTACNLTNGQEYTGYAQGKRIRIPNGASVTFTNLTIKADLYPAVEVLPQSASSATSSGAIINLKGNNSLIGGIGSAALRVPINAKVTINGPGALVATGGDWRSLIGTDAGAGIGGGWTGSTASAVNHLTAMNSKNLTDHCGTVVINGGTITAYGGGSGNSSNTNNVGSYYSYAAGIGGSGNAGNGCYLTINGGTVTAIGGVSGRNDIGPGILGTSENPPATYGTSGNPGITTINGGSVNANILAGTSITNSIVINATATTANGVSNSSNIPATGTRNTIIVTNGSVTASSSSNNIIVSVGNCNNTNCTTSSTTCRSIANTGTLTNINYPAMRCTGGACNGVTFSYNGVTTAAVNVSQNNCAYISNYVETVINAIVNSTNNSNNIKTNIGVSSNSTVSKREITVGYTNLNETNGQPISPTTNNNVYGCQFGTMVNNASNRITCNNSCDWTVASNSCSSRRYGMTDVKTDYNSKVYFWLPDGSACTSNCTNTPRSTDDFITLKINNTTDKTYKPDNTTTTGTAPNYYYYFNGKLPEMRAPTTPNNTVVLGTFTEDSDNDRIYDGPYKTGFQTRIARVGSKDIMQNVGAVGNTITLYRGKYVRNDAGTEASSQNRNNNSRVHDVRWYRTTELDADGNPVGGEPITTNSSKNYISAFSEIVQGSYLYPADTVQYKPTAEDYGKYVYARVYVRDNSTRPNGNTRPTDDAAWSGDNVVFYPPIRIGVVVTSTGTTTIENTTLTTKVEQGTNSPEDKLFFPIVPSNTAQTPAHVTLNATATLVPTELALYEWKATNTAINRACVTNATPPAVPITSGCFASNGDAMSEFRLPVAKYTYGTDEMAALPGDTIKLNVTVSKINTAFKVKQIDFYYKNSPPDPEYTVKALSISIDDNNNAVINQQTDRIPQNGQIRLVFAASGVDTNPLESLGGTLSIEGIPNENIEKVNHITYNYNYLEPGTAYNIYVEGFRISQTLIAFTPSKTIFVVEQPSTSSIKYMVESGQLVDTLFRVGETRKAETSFVPNAGTDLDEECYYWEQVTSTNPNGPSISVSWGKDANGTTINPAAASGEGTYASPTKFNKIYCAPKASYSTSKSSPPLVADDFSKWVRLVMRPKSTKRVNGIFEGKEIAGEWKQVGILLKPVYESDLSITATTYNNIMFRECRQTGDYVSKGCYGSGGFFVSNYNEVRLIGAPQQDIVNKKYYNIDYWEAFASLSDIDLEHKTDPTKHKPINASIISNNEDNCTNNTTAHLCIDWTYNPMNLKVLGNASQSTYYIRPNTVEIAPPTVDVVKIMTMRGSKEVSSEDIIDAVIGSESNPNKINIEFYKGANDDLKVKLGGSVRIRDLSDNSPTAEDKPLNCSEEDLDDGLFTKLNCKLPMLYEATAPFGKRYMVVVSGYVSSTGDPMGAAAYYFSTGSGPTFDKVPDFKSDGLKANLGEYAVGHKIELDGDILNDEQPNPNYKPQAGGAQDKDGHTYVWQRSSEKFCTSSNGCQTVTPTNSSFKDFLTNGYTPTFADFNKYIRLAITPKDVNGKAGSVVYGEWLRVGVKTSIAVDSTQTLGNMTIVLGSTDILPNSDGINSSTDYEVIYGNTRVKVASSEPGSDKFKGWTKPTDVEGIIGELDDITKEVNENLAVQIATFKPNTPTGDISLKARVKDESKPIVKVEKSSDKLVFSIDQLYKGSTPKVILINDVNSEVSISSSCLTDAISFKLSELKNADGNDETYNSTTSSFSVTFGKGVLKDLTIQPQCRYQVGITANAFKDDKCADGDGGNTTCNLSEANSNLKTFTNDAVYSASLSSPYEFSNGNGVEFGYSTSGINTLTMTNNDDPITLGATFSSTKDDRCTSSKCFSVTASPVLGTIINSTNKTQTFTVTPQANLPVGRYEDILLIGTSDGAVAREVKVTFIVNAKEIKNEKLIATPVIEKYYNSSPLAALNNSDVWNNDEQIADAKVITTDPNGIAKNSAYYSDPNVGYPKAISVHYRIVNADCNETEKPCDVNKNYVFENGSQIYAKPASEVGNIKAPKVVISLLDGDDIGEKFFDGSNTLTKDKMRSITKGSDYELIFKDENDALITDIENLGLTLDFSLVALADVNVNVDANQQVISTNVSSIPGFALKDEIVSGGENNYTDVKVDGYSNWKAKIKPISLASLVDLEDDGKPKAEFFGQVGKNSPAKNCVVAATAVYGDKVSEYESWKSSLKTTCGVSKDGLVVAGNWYLCNEKSTGLCTRKGEDGIYYYIPTSDIVPLPKPILYAQFVPSGIASSNYDESLIVKVNLDVKKKNINVETKSHVKKVYDKTNTIKADEKITLYSRDAVGNDILGENEIVADNANSYFNEVTVGTKAVLVKWKLTDAVFSKYSYADGSEDGSQTGQTSTFGTIEPRPLILLGLKGENRYYQERPNAQGVYQGIFDVNVDESGIPKLVAEGKDIFQEGGLIPGDKVWYDKTKDVTFQYINPNADPDKPIVPKSGRYFLAEKDGNTTDKDNYVLSLDSLYGTIYPSSLGHYWCFKIDASNPLCSHTDSSKTEEWFRQNRETVANELIKLKKNQLDTATATYGDTYSTISDVLYSILPSRLDSVMMGVRDNERISGSWIWARSGRVPPVGAATHPVAFVHSNPNYSSLDTILVPLKVAPKQLTLTNVYAIPRDYNTCIDMQYPCDEEVAKRVDLSYKLSGIVDDELPLKDKSVVVTAWLEDFNAGENKKVLSNIEVLWNGSDIRYDNYIKPPSTYDIPPVTIGRAGYPLYVPSPITVVEAHGNKNALIYDYQKYQRLSRVDFDQPLDEFGKPMGIWSWVDVDREIPNPSLFGRDFIDTTFAASYVPGGYIGEMYMSSPNYRPADSLVAIRIYDRSKNSEVSFVKVESECGAETARVTVSASDDYATIWFNENQYFDNEKAQNTGTFQYSGLEYGSNYIPYRVKAHAYLGTDYTERIGTNYSVHHNRLLPFTSVARSPQGKALTVALDSSFLQEKMFFRKYLDKDVLDADKFDLTKTRWFKGKDSVGTGLILPVTSTAADAVGGYSLVLYSKSGKPIVASCKQLGGMPELPPNLDYLPTVNIAKLVATPYGARIAAGGTSLLFNTPNGGKVSIYTIKGELVSRMTVVEDRTVVKLPAVRGMYIVKLEAK